MKDPSPAERERRYLQIADAVGEIAGTNPILFHIAQKHAHAEKFALADCLAEMVKVLAQLAADTEKKYADLYINSPRRM